MIILFAAFATLVFAVILVIAYGFYFIQTYQAQSVLDRLKSANAELAKKTDDMQVFKRRQEQLEKQKKMIEALQKMQFDWADLLNDIALLLPNEVWLTELKATMPTPADAAQVANKAAGQSTNEVTLTGFSTTGQTGVAKTLARLSDIQLLQNVSLNFSQESNFGQRRITQFEIKAQLNLPKELTQSSPTGGTAAGAGGAAQ